MLLSNMPYFTDNINEYLDYVICEEVESRFSDDKEDGLHFYDNTICDSNSFKDYCTEFLSEKISDPFLLTAILKTIDWHTVWSAVVDNCKGDADEARELLEAEDEEDEDKK